tara:strand:- start:647 stop:1402 length:756 start_codon:yes stop_codon:yes gene_type:complete
MVLVLEKRPSCVLLTRPVDESLVLQKKLEDRGIQSLINPLLEIVTFSPEDLETSLDGFPEITGFILTSRHGLLALKYFSPDKTLPVFVVGDATRKACLEAGFRKVYVAQNSAESLSEILKSHAFSEKDFIVYLSGKDITKDLSLSLEERGIKSKRLVSYVAEPAAVLAPGVLQALVERNLTDVIFFSARTAQIFVTLIRKYHLETAMSVLRAHGVSEIVLENLKDLNWFSMELVSPSSDDLIQKLCARGMQ